MERNEISRDDLLAGATFVPEPSCLPWYPRRRLHPPAINRLTWAVLAGAAISDGCTSADKPMGMALLDRDELYGAERSVMPAKRRVQPPSDWEDARTRLPKASKYIAAGLETADRIRMMELASAINAAAPRPLGMLACLSAAQLFERTRHDVAPSWIDRDLTPASPKGQWAKLYENEVRDRPRRSSSRRSRARADGKVMCNGKSVPDASIRMAVDRGNDANLRFYVEGARHLYWDGQYVPQRFADEFSVTSGAADPAASCDAAPSNVAEAAQYFLHVNARVAGIAWSRLAGPFAIDDVLAGDIELTPAASLAGSLETGIRDYAGWKLVATHHLGGWAEAEVLPGGVFCVEHLYDGDWTLHLVPSGEDGEPRAIRVDPDLAHWANDEAETLQLARTARVQAGRTTCIGAWALDVVEVQLDELFPTNLANLGSWRLGVRVDPYLEEGDSAFDSVRFVHLSGERAALWAGDPTRPIEVRAALGGHGIEATLETTIEELSERKTFPAVELAFVEGIVELDSLFAGTYIDDLILRFHGGVGPLNTVALGALDHRGAFGPLVVPAGAVLLEVEDPFSGVVATAEIAIRRRDADWEDANARPHWISARPTVALRTPAQDR